MNLTKRKEKGSPLTWSEMDENWSDIEAAIELLIKNGVGGDVSDAITAHEANSAAHQDIRNLLTWN